MGSPPTDVELQQLMLLLLRVVSPPAGPGAETAGQLAVSAPQARLAASAPQSRLAVSASEARALTELLAARGIAQGQLATLLGLEKSTVSRLAAGLERKGWIRRGRDAANQRYIRLYLTPGGRALAGRVWRAWWTRQARILAGLSDQEREGLAIGLRGLARSLAAEGLLGELTPGPQQASPGPAGAAPAAHPPTLAGSANASGQGDGRT